MERLVELCALMGGRYLVHGSPKQRSVPAGETAPSRDRARRMPGARRGAPRRGLRRHLLPGAAVDARNRLRQHRGRGRGEIVEQVGSPALKTMIDCSAAGQVETEPVADLMARWMPTGHIAHVQVNDPNRRGPGQGAMAFAPILSRCACRRAGPLPGIVAVEPFDYVPDGRARRRAPSATCAVCWKGWHGMTEAPRFRIREIALHERPVRLRLPFRFGVVTLTECPQAFARVRIELADGRSAWGGAAELMAPKWFDKNLALSNDDNFEQLRSVLRWRATAYFADSSPTPPSATSRATTIRTRPPAPRVSSTRCWPATARRWSTARCWTRCAVRGACRSTPRCAATCRASANATRPSPASTGRPSCGAATGGPIAARHTVGLVDAITAADLQHPVNDGLPETLEQVVAHYGHRHFKLKVGGRIDDDVARLTAIAAVLDRSPPTTWPRSTATSSMPTPKVCRAAGGHAGRPRWRACCVRSCSSNSRSRARPRSTCGRAPPGRDQAGDRRRVRRRARRLRARVGDGLHRHLQQDLQGLLQVAAERRALRAWNAEAMARTTSCRPKT
jgi:hypothetical protein